MTTIRLFLLSLLWWIPACGDSAVPPPRADTLPPDATDSSLPLPDGPITSTYEGERPPRDGYCDADEADVMLLAELPTTVRIDSRRSLLDQARPSLACAIGGAIAAPDVVFSYRADDAGVFTLRTVPVDRDVWTDTVVYLRTSCDGTGDELACADDEGLRTRTSRLTAELEAGQPIFAIVDGFTQHDVGEVDVSVDFIPAPTPSPAGGDTCAEATPLVFSGTGDTRLAVAMGDTRDATSDGGCDAVPSTRAVPERHHAFTLEEVRDVSIRVIPASYWDVVIYVRTACDSPDALACTDDRPPSGEENITLEALEPGRYILAVDAFEHPTRPEWVSGAYHLEVMTNVP